MENRMTCSQALRRISVIKKTIHDNRDRASRSVVHLLQNEPAFVFSECATAANTAVKELVTLQTALALANAKAEVEWQGAKVSLGYAVRLLSEVKSELTWYKNLVVRDQDSTEETKFDYPQTTPTGPTDVEICVLFA